VETGLTLEENGLEIREGIAESTARLVINRTRSHVQSREIQELLNRLQAVLG